MEAVWRQRRAGTWEGAVKGSCQGWWQQRWWHVHTTGQQQRAVVVAHDRASDPSTWLLFYAAPRFIPVSFCPYHPDAHTSTGLSRSQEAGGEVGLEHVAVVVACNRSPKVWVDHSLERHHGQCRLGAKNLERVHARSSGVGDAVRATLRRGHSYMKMLQDWGKPNRCDTLTQW